MIIINKRIQIVKCMRPHFVFPQTHKKGFPQTKNKDVTRTLVCLPVRLFFETGFLVRYLIVYTVSKTQNMCLVEDCVLHPLLTVSVDPVELGGFFRPCSGLRGPAFEQLGLPLPACERGAHGWNGGNRTAAPPDEFQQRKCRFPLFPLPCGRRGVSCFQPITASRVLYLNH